MITILYFARLRETLGRASEPLELPADVCDIDSLRARLSARGGAWAVTMADRKKVRAAVNQELAPGNAAIKDGDEIAFFPPVTGG